MNVIFFHGEVFKLSSNHYYLPILSRILECLNTLLNRIWCWWLTFPLLNHNKTQQHFFLFSCTILVKFHNRKRHFGGLFKLTKSTHLSTILYWFWIYNYLLCQHCRVDGFPLSCVLWHGILVMFKLLFEDSISFLKHV